MYTVLVIERETADVVKEIKCGSENKANKIADGININLDHEKLFTTVRRDKQ